MKNKDSKSESPNYKFFPFDYGGFKGGIKQFFLAISANTIFLARLSPFYFTVAVTADIIIFKLTGYQYLWAWSILLYIIIGAVLALIYLVFCYCKNAGVKLYDDSTVIIKTVFSYRRAAQNFIPYLRYGKEYKFRVWEISGILMPKHDSYNYRKNRNASYFHFMGIPAYGQFIYLEIMNSLVFTFVLQNNESFYNAILKLKSGSDEKENGDYNEQ